MTAYCETCASIGDIFTNHRLFLLHGETKYIDILEKTLYNSALSGVSLSADRFFYPNPLESNGQHQRQAWFGCACCPSNVARFVPAIPGYIYAVTDQDIFINLFISNDAEFMVGQKKVRLTQKADFPWEGKTSISVFPENDGKFSVRVRIPGWIVNEAIPGGLYRFDDQYSQPYSIKVNGEDAETVVENGYAVIERKWEKGDNIEVDFPMPVRKVVADERIKDDIGKVAIQRGPVIYCAEWPDNNNGNILNLVIDRDSPITTEYIDTLLEGTQVIRIKGSQTKKTLDGTIEKLEEEQVTLIPYALWNNRGPGQMMVWLPYTTVSTRPLPAPTIAFRSKLKASKMTRLLTSVNDQELPDNSNDHSLQYYHWWPNTNQWEWLQYDFERPETISKTKVYWFDDRPDGGCRIPDEWEILYLSDNIWKPVRTKTKYTVTRNGWDSIQFAPVRTSSLKIKVKLNKDFSSGLYEWIVE
jgi:hypothetical protein